MRSFRDFLREEDPCWKGYKQVGMKKKGKRKVPNCVPVNEAWKYSEKTHQTYAGPETVKQHTHTTTIDGKKVSVGFGHNVGYHDEGTWDVHFEVGHSMEAPGNTSASTAKKILKHVGNVTQSFVQKHNPKQLTWSPVDLEPGPMKKKAAIYKALAKRHGVANKLTSKHANIFGAHEATLKLREDNWQKQKFGSDSHIHTNNARVGDSFVQVNFTHDPVFKKHGEGDYEVGFAVNHKMSADDDHNEHAHKILRHVANKVKEFKEKHNPKSLSYIASDENERQTQKKDNIYRHMVRKLVKGVKAKHTKEYDEVEGRDHHKFTFREEWSYEKKHRPAFNMTSHFAHHDAEIDGHKVRTTFVNSTHSPKQHTVSFTVDGNLSAEKGKAHKASTAKKIIQHVRGITKEYIAKHNPHEINFSGMDEDPKKQKVKNVIYQRLAKKAGAKITSKDTGEFVQNRIKLREEWKRKENGPDGEHEITHTSKIGKHEVQVKFDHDPIEKPHDHGDYELSFSVNDKMSAHGQGKEHAVKIFKHVADKVKEFKAKHKPKSISYMASDEDGFKTDKKDHIYHRMAKRLIGSAKAKHTVEPGSGGWADTHKFEFSEGRDSPEHGFHSVLRNYAYYHGGGNHIDIYHESPGHVKKSIEKHGFNPDHQEGDHPSLPSADGIFATVGQPSGYVTQKKKTIVHLRVPAHHAEKYFAPDMPYGNRPGSKTEDPHDDFVDHHGRDDGKGGDVYYDHPKPHKFIHKITEVG